MMRTITSKDNQKVKLAYSLKLKKNREKTNLFLSEGKKNLDMAIEAKCVRIVFTKFDLFLDENCNFEIYKVNEEIINKLSSEKNPEGIVFIAKKIDYNYSPDLYNKIVYLDDVSDPGNLGTIIRTALAFNYDAVVLSKNCVDFYNEKVISASKGAMFFLPVFYGDLLDFKDRTIYVSSLDSKAKDLNYIQKTTKFILVLGNESKGVSKESLELANYIVKIDISDKIDSLNVAVAAGILMNYLR